MSKEKKTLESQAPIAEDTKPEARQSLVKMVMEAMAIPEDQLSAGPDVPVGEGEEVIGPVNLTARRLFTYSNRTADEVENLIAKDSLLEGASTDETLDVLGKMVRGARVTQVFDQLTRNAITAEIGAGRSVGIRQGWQLVALKDEIKHDCENCEIKGQCPIEGKMRQFNAMKKGEADAIAAPRKSMVEMIAEAMAMPESEIDKGASLPMEEDSKVVGEANADAKRLHTYRDRLIDETQTILRKMLPPGKLDHADFILVYRIREEIKMMDDLLWDSVQCQTGVYNPGLALRDGWKIVALETESDMLGQFETIISEAVKNIPFG